MNKKLIKKGEVKMKKHSFVNPKLPSKFQCKLTGAIFNTGKIEYKNGEPYMVYADHWSKDVSSKGFHMFTINFLETIK